MPRQTVIQGAEPQEYSVVEISSPSQTQKAGYTSDKDLFASDSKIKTGISSWFGTEVQGQQAAPLMQNQPEIFSLAFGKQELYKLPSVNALHRARRQRRAQEVELKISKSCSSQEVFTGSKNSLKLHQKSGLSMKRGRSTRKGASDPLEKTKPCAQPKKRTIPKTEVVRGTSGLTSSKMVSHGKKRVRRHSANTSVDSSQLAISEPFDLQSSSEESSTSDSDCRPDNSNSSEVNSDDDFQARSKMVSQGKKRVRRLSSNTSVDASPLAASEPSDEQSVESSSEDSFTSDSDFITTSSYSSEVTSDEDLQASVRARPSDLTERKFQTAKELQCAKSSQTKSKLMVGAIDFGTTYSGWAYSFDNDFKADPTKSFCQNWSSGKQLSSKAPTTVLVNPDGEALKAFGYEAEDQYSTLVDEGEYRDYYYFRHFKMTLYENKELNRHTLLEDDKGKTLPAHLVFSMVIRYLKDDLLKQIERKLVFELEEDEIQWVLTVPAIWNIRAKQFMRQCAVQAGIKSENLLIALEPEAASLYCKYLAVQKQNESDEARSTLTVFKPGTRYMVIDAGGGTIDIVVHQVTSDGSLEEIYAANGSNWGGKSVDIAFFNFLASIVGEDVMRRLKEEHMDDYLDLQREFDVKKQDIKPSQKGMIKVKIPVALSEIFKSIKGQTIMDTVKEISDLNGRVKFMADKILVDSKIIQDCFEQSTDAIVRHVKDIFQREELQDTKFILMVGGYSESTMLFETVKGAFPDKKVILPEDAGLSVLKGAVIFGHDKKDITVRVSQYTYGYKVYASYDPSIHPKERMILKDGKKLVRGSFHVLVRRGEKLTPNMISKGKRALPRKGRHGFGFKLFASKDPNPAFVDDPECFQLRQISVDCRDEYGKINPCDVYLQFGGTEFVAYAEQQSAEKKMTKISFDFLE